MYVFYRIRSHQEDHTLIGAVKDFHDDRLLHCLFVKQKETRYGGLINKNNFISIDVRDGQTNWAKDYEYCLN